MSAPSVLIIQHTPRGGPRRLLDWLHEDGLTTDVIEAHTGALVPGRLTHDSVVVLGGGYVPDDDARAPWLPTTRALVHEALDRARPVFGICLGGQLLAQVAGGAVQADAGRPEHGSTPIRLLPEASGDPLFAGLPEVVPAIEHHVDVISELPPGAVWLAATDRCPYQAFRSGPTAWGVQFHPEVTADRILQWDSNDLDRAGLDQRTLYEAALADEEESARVWREVARRFAGVVHRSVTLDPAPAAQTPHQ